MKNSAEIPPNAVPSPEESARLGMAVGRMPISGTVGARACVEALEGAPYDLVVLRFDRAENPHLPFHLARSRLLAWEADTLLRFRTDLPARGAADANDPRWVASVLGAGDAARVTQCVREIFPGYLSHYASNPMIDPEAALDGYAQWAVGYLGRGDCAVLAVLPADARGIAGLCTMSVADGHAEVALAGVHPDFRRRGAYQRLLAEAECHALAGGCATLGISTQATTAVAVRVWEGRGYRYAGAEVTMHVMKSGGPALDI